MPLVFSRTMTQIFQWRMETENKKRAPYGTKNQCLAVSAFKRWKDLAASKKLHPNL